MSKCFGLTIFFRHSSRSFYVPNRTWTLAQGSHFLISLYQFCWTDLGQITRCFPLMPLYSLRYAMYEIDWIVFPRPISSASIPLASWVARPIIHSRDYSWCCCRVPPMRLEGCVTSKCTLYLLMFFSLSLMFMSFSTCFLSFYILSRQFCRLLLALGRYINSNILYLWVNAACFIRINILAHSSQYIKNSYWILLSNHWRGAVAALSHSRVSLSSCNFGDSSFQTLWWYLSK